MHFTLITEYLPHVPYRHSGFRFFFRSAILFSGEIPLDGADDEEQSDLQLEDLVTNPCLRTRAISTPLPTRRILVRTPNLFH